LGSSKIFLASLKIEIRLPRTQLTNEKMRPARDFEPKLERLISKSKTARLSKRPSRIIRLASRSSRSARIWPTRFNRYAPLNRWST
jgi:hypothetical protein